jgi:hypothetical protein
MALVDEVVGGLGVGLLGAHHRAGCHQIVEPIPK